MSKKTILVTGGCRSGKSRYALSLAQNVSGQKIFLATAQAEDEEMRDRIALHRRERGAGWITVEEPLDPVKVLRENTDQADVLLLDCLTLWISNLLMKNMGRKEILENTQALVEETARFKGILIFITNEVGAGIVPENKLARHFRDIAGEVNQRIAHEFDEVVHMVSGIPSIIKKPEDESEIQVAKNNSDHEFSETKKQGLYDAIYKRRDMRHFTSRPVPPAVLGKILQAAHHAGSVGYMQPWNFIVIDDLNIKERVAEIFQKANLKAERRFKGVRKKLYRSLKLEGITDAPVNIFVTCDRTRFGPHVLGRDSQIETDLFSTCCAVQNLWLAARAEGLGVGWVSILSNDDIKKLLHVPDHVVPVAYLCVGYPESFYQEPMLETVGWGKRLNLEDLVFYNRWEGEPGDFTIELPREKSS